MQLSDAVCAVYKFKSIADFFTTAPQIQVLAGIHYLLKDQENETFIQATGVADIHTHPHRDIALLKLNTPVRLNDRVSPICLLDTKGKYT